MASSRRKGAVVGTLEWVLLAVIPALGLFALWLALDRWGRKNDPMAPTRFDHLTPGAPDRSRSSFDD